MGLGYPSYTSIFTDILSLPVKRRCNIEDYPIEYAKPKMGDYLLFAIACRWISSLVYVVHPESKGDDYLWFCVRQGEKDVTTGGGFRSHENLTVENVIHLPCLAGEDMKNFLLRNNLREICNNSTQEPEVPFIITNDYDSIKSFGTFDYLVFSKSPNYTIASGDYIVDIIREYIEEI